MFPPPPLNQAGASGAPMISAGQSLRTGPLLRTGIGTTRNPLAIYDSAASRSVITASHHLGATAPHRRAGPITLCNPGIPNLAGARPFLFGFLDQSARDRPVMIAAMELAQRRLESLAQRARLEGSAERVSAIGEKPVLRTPACPALAGGGLWRPVGALAPYCVLESIEEPCRAVLVDLARVR
jgi:hypothetical protein